MPEITFAGTIVRGFRLDALVLVFLLFGGLSALFVPMLVLEVSSGEETSKLLASSWPSFRCARGGVC